MAKKTKTVEIQLVDELESLDAHATAFQRWADGLLETDEELAGLGECLAEAIWDYRAQALALWRRDEEGFVPSAEAAIKTAEGVVCPPNATPTQKVGMFFEWARGARALSRSLNEVADEAALARAASDIANAYMALGVAFASRLGVSLSSRQRKTVAESGGSREEFIATLLL